MLLLPLDKKILLDKDIQEYTQSVEETYGVRLDFTIRGSNSKNSTTYCLEKLKKLFDNTFGDGKDLGICIHNRKPKEVLYRHMFCRVAFDLGFNYQTIGKFINKDRTTIINAVSMINDYQTKYPQYGIIYDKISKIITNDIGIIQHTSQEQNQS